MAPSLFFFHRNTRPRTEKNSKKGVKNGEYHANFKTSEKVFKIPPKKLTAKNVTEI
jgi:hypothetical protein